MKVDGLGIILIIIILPIMLLTTFYIQLEVDTVSTENYYNTKLLSSTYDAMYALELNTANEQLSSVADSLRSIIEASNNTFLNSLATNLGMSNASKELLQPYIPAVLYTMYDGYYIYTPTEKLVVAEKIEENGDLKTATGYHYVGDGSNECKDVSGNYGDVIYEKNGGGYTTNKDEAKTEVDYILKPYMQYSGRYVNDGNKIDVTINYSLDNYINIVGTIGNVYYTKTGYLINDTLVTQIKFNDNEIAKNTANEKDIENAILGVKTNNDDTTIHACDNPSVTVDSIEISAKWDNIVSENGLNDSSIKTISEAEEKLKTNTDLSLDNYNNVLYEIQKYKAIAYYASSACFSNWVYSNLGSLEYKDIKDEAIQSNFKSGFKSLLNNIDEEDKSEFYYDFSGNTSRIFDKTQNPEESDSNFNTHKLEVIKNSIKYNLNFAISAYANQMNTSYDFNLPVLADSEWDKILNNISIVSFMQGWDCKLDVYNNYAISSSTNNELMVTPEEIYYVEKDLFNNGESFYHRINCNQILNGDSNSKYISFKSKEVKYDKIYDDSTGKYGYDHKNLACYECINNPNNTKKTTSLTDKQKEITYIGVGTQRQDMYKTNALSKSEGYKISDITGTIKTNSNFRYNNINSDVKKIEITLKENVRARDENGNMPSIIFISCNGLSFAINNQLIEQTIIIETNGASSITLSGKDVENYKEFNISILSVKEIYK